MANVAKEFVRKMSTKLLRDRAFINGKWVQTAAQLEVTNPANGKVIGTVPDCSVDDAKEAVKAAKEAFEHWGFKTTAKVKKITNIS